MVVTLPIQWRESYFGELLLPIGIDSRKQLLQQLWNIHAGSSGHPKAVEATGSMIGNRTTAQPHVQHVEIDKLLLAIALQPPLRPLRSILHNHAFIWATVLQYH